MKLLKSFITISSLISLFITVGCGEKNFSTSSANKVQSFNLDGDDGYGAGLAPVSIAYGGNLQFDYYDLSLSDENRMGVESLIGQPVLAHSKSSNGIRVDVGYPSLQGSFLVQ